MNFPLATEYHLGLLKAKLARYRAQLIEPTTKSGAKVSAYVSILLTIVCHEHRLVPIKPLVVTYSSVLWIYPTSLFVHVCVCHLL